MILYKYLIWCNTDGKFEEVISETEPTICPVNPAHSVDTSKTYINSKIPIVHVGIDYALDGTYSTSSETYSQLPVQIISPKLGDYDKTKLECKIVLDYYTENAIVGNVELFDYRTYVTIPNSEVVMPNVSGWTVASSGWLDITSYENTSIRIRSKVQTKLGNDSFYIEGAKLIFRLS